VSSLIADVDSDLLSVLLEYFVIWSMLLGDFKELYLWSVENYDRFWEEFWHFANIFYSKPYDQVQLVYSSSFVQAIFSGSGYCKEYGRGPRVV